MLDFNEFTYVELIVFIGECGMYACAYDCFSQIKSFQTLE